MNGVPCSAKSETPLLYRAVFEIIKGKFGLSEEDYREGIVKLFERLDCQAGKLTCNSFKISAKTSKQLEELSISSLIFEKIFLNQQALTQFYNQSQDFTDFEDEATQIIDQYFYQLKLLDKKPEAILGKPVFLGKPIFLSSNYLEQLIREKGVIKITGSAATIGLTVSGGFITTESKRKPITKSQCENIGKNLIAKDEHLAMLKQGIDTWNTWRQENYDIIPLLSRVDLRDVKLRGANLMRTNLSGADLSGKDLSGNNLSETNLSNTNLSRIQALGTNLDGAIFTGACIQDWNINSKTNLNNVICEYVYLREEQQERRPINENFVTGEFTKLFQESLETVDLIFREGVDWKAFAYSLANTQIENEGTPLAIQSIDNKGDGTVVIKVSVSADADKTKIHRDFMEGYEFAKRELEPQYQARIEDKDKEIDRLFYSLNQAQEKLGEFPKLITKKPTYDLRGAKFGGGFGGENQEGGTFYDYSSSSNTSLTEAAAEIQQLLEQLSKTNPTATTAEKMAVVTEAAEQIEKNPTLKARVIGALKSGGTEAFKEAIDHPLVNIFVATIEGWKDAE